MRTWSVYQYYKLLGTLYLSRLTIRAHLTFGIEIRLVRYNDHGEVVAVFDAQYLLMELCAGEA